MDKEKLRGIAILEVGNKIKNVDLPTFTETFELLYKVLTEQNSHKHSVMQAEGSDGEHLCKYCGVSTNQPDDECYAKPSAKEAAVGKEREAKPVRVRTKMFQCKCGYETDSSLMWNCHADSCSA